MIHELWLSHICHEYYGIKQVFAGKMNVTPVENT